MQVMMPIDLQQIRARVSELLNQMGSLLVGDPDNEKLQADVAKLGQVAAGLAVIDQQCLPQEGAGYGSRVEVMDIDTGEVGEYVLMVGLLVDIAANQVSLASPVGQALLGATAGEEVEITTPHKRSRLRVTKVVTLLESLDAYEV
jgi:transcription elongation GreA/GreB family factor